MPPKDSKEKKSKNAASGLAESTYINRELSWLAFNQRVLLEAADPTVPLLERLKFLMIYQSNLTEFYRVRIGILTHRALLTPEKGDPLTGLRSLYRYLLLSFLDPNILPTWSETTVPFTLRTLCTFLLLRISAPASKMFFPPATSASISSSNP